MFVLLLFLLAFIGFDWFVCFVGCLVVELYLVLIYTWICDKLSLV